MEETRMDLSQLHYARKLGLKDISLGNPGRKCCDKHPSLCSLTIDQGIPWKTNAQYMKQLVVELGLGQVTSQPHQKCPREIWGEKRNY
jgi:hypothetical protein